MRIGDVLLGSGCPFEHEGRTPMTQKDTKNSPGSKPTGPGSGDKKTGK